MPRKLLFLVFTEDPCKMTHAFLYALDLKQHGHLVKIILEGGATRKVSELYRDEKMFQPIFDEAKAEGLLSGACKTASHGCGNQDTPSTAQDWLNANSVPLLDDLDGHAGISSWIQAGYEIISF